MCPPNQVVYLPILSIKCHGGQSKYCKGDAEICLHYGNTLCQCHKNTRNILLHAVDLYASAFSYIATIALILDMIICQHELILRSDENHNRMFLHTFGHNLKSF